MTLHICENISPRLRTTTNREYARLATNEEYVRFAMSIARPL
jgi:hypothetical protein